MNTEKQVPDGGWGWAVVAGSAIINIVNQSLLSMFGLIFGAKLESIAGTTGVTTVMSLNCTISNFSGFIISPLSKYFSTKQITQIGVLLVSAGLALSTYTKSYMRITLGYGVLTGLGLGLIASSTFLIINSYFDKNKSQAVGLSMAGTSIGQMGMPLIVAHLIQHYSYDGTILILSSLSLHGLIGSMFFDPVSEHMLEKNRSKSRSFFSRLSRISSRREPQPVVIENDLRLNGNQCDVENKSVNNNIDKTSSINGVGSKSDVNCNKNQNYVEIINENQAQNNNKADEIKKEEEKEILSGEADSLMEETTIKQTETCFSKFVKFFDLQILLDPGFVHIMIGLSFAYTTSISFSTFFPLFLSEDLDMSVIDVSTCMSVLSFMDFTGRIIVPLITKRLEVTHRVTFILASFFLAICRSLLAIQTTYVMIIVFSALSGLSRAATVINQNLVIAEYSKQHISSAVGLNMVSKGIFVLTIGRLLGMYKDSAHNFASCIHILNIISMGVVISWSIELIIKKLFRRKN